MRDVSVKLWMKVVALRKPLVLVALLVFGIVVIYELSKSVLASRHARKYIYGLAVQCLRIYMGCSCQK